MKKISAESFYFKKFHALFIISLVVFFAVAQPLVFIAKPAYSSSSVKGSQSYPQFVITFTESGLPNSTVWYVTLNGSVTSLLNGLGPAGSSAKKPLINTYQSYPNLSSLSSYFSNLSSTSGTISFTVPEGVYSYNIGTVPGYAVSPSSGTINLTSDVTITVKFTNLNVSNLNRLNVTFFESGLPIGLKGVAPVESSSKVVWSVTLGNQTLSTNGTALRFINIKAGNYTWVAHTVNLTDAYYTAIPASGKIFVPLTSFVTVNYTGYAKVNIEPDNALFGSVKPAGTHWYRVGSKLNLTAVPGFESAFFEWVSNGAVPFYNYNSANITTTITGPGNITAEFATAVVFKESGIPQGGRGTTYEWGIKVVPLSPFALVGYNSSMFWGSYYQNPVIAENRSDIILYLTNGTYQVDAETGSNQSFPPVFYSPINANRTITVNAQMLSFDIDYVEGVPVNFTETGLPKGTPWAIDINGTYHNFIAGYTTTVYIPPGIPMSFSVQPVTGYSISPESGTMDFSGPSTFSVSFNPVSPTGQVYSQYTGYFYSGIPVYNEFGFNGSWGSASPIFVASNVGTFNPPSKFNRYWTISGINMGSFNSSFDLVVHVTYPNGAVLNYSYPVSVISSPQWLVAFAHSPYVTMSVSQPVKQWGNPYALSFETSLSTGTLLTVNANLNIISGDYAFMPSVPLKLTLTSSGNMSLSTTINPNSVTIKLDSVSLTMGGSISLSGSFQLSQNTIVWKSATVDLKFNTKVSTSILITGIQVPETDYTVGIWLTLGAGPDFAVLVHLQPTTNGNFEITQGVPLMVSGIEGGVGVTITISVNGGLSNIVSAGGGGGLTFMQYIGVPPEPLNMGGNITGTVFISATAFGISWTVWQDSGLLYSWGASNDPAVNHAGNVTFVKAYFNLTGYNSLVWKNGSWNGTLLHDVYPYTTFSTVKGAGGDYLFYTYYNASQPIHPLTIKGVLMASGRNATAIAMPDFGSYETTGPEAFVLPNGSVELLYAALPVSQVKNSSSLFAINRVLLQSSVYNGSSWSRPVNITSTGVANSYTYSNGYALVIETPNLFSQSSEIQEYSVSTGKLVMSMPLANATYFEYFNPELSTAVVRFSNMSYAMINLGKGTVTGIKAPVNSTLLQVGSAENSSNTVYFLLSSEGRDVFELYNVTSSKVMYVQNVSANAFPSYFVYGYPESALITGKEPSGVNVYAVNLSSGSSELYASINSTNVTYYGVSEGGGNLYIYSMNSYGLAYQPLYNISAAIIPFSPPPEPALSLQYNGTGIIALWSVPHAQQYSVSTVYLKVNGSTISSGASGKAFYPVKSAGDYVFTLSAGNILGTSSKSVSMGIYQVTFSESGLQAGSTWSATLNGSTEYSNGSSITFIEPSGVYLYRVGNVSGYSVSPGSGYLTVSGKNAGIPVAFMTAKEYTVVFTESGLSQGTRWSVTLNGSTKTSTNSSIAFTVPAGEYSYSVSPVSGYSYSGSTGTVMAGGQNTTVKAAPVTFISSQVSKPQQTGSNPELYVAAGAIAAVAVILAVLGRKKLRK